MLVTSFLEQVDVGLIDYQELVAAVAEAYPRGVGLVAVAYVYAVEAAAHEHRNGVGRAVRHASVEHLLVVGVYKPARHVAPPCHAVGAHEH